MTELENLMDALRSDDPNLRQRAAMRLGAIDASPVMGDLVPAMAGEADDFVRETLTWAVVARPEAATPELTAALDRADLPHEPVLHALSKVGDPATVGAILPHAADADPLVAAKAWWALSRIPSAEQVLPTLLSHLGSADARRRHGLTRALLQFGGAAVQPLAGQLDSDDPAVRSHAAEVLVAFADETRYGIVERRAGLDASAQAAGVLRHATAPEVDGALLLATVSDDRPGLVAAAERLRGERA